MLVVRSICEVCSRENDAWSRHSFQCSSGCACMRTHTTFFWTKIQSNIRTSEANQKTKIGGAPDSWWMGRRAVPVPHPPPPPRAATACVQPACRLPPQASPNKFSGAPFRALFLCAWCHRATVCQKGLVAEGGVRIRTGVAGCPRPRVTPVSECNGDLGRRRTCCGRNGPQQHLQYPHCRWVMGKRLVTGGNMRSEAGCAPLPSSRSC